VYGFLGDVNLFHGRAHEGQVHLDGVSIESPEHHQTQDAAAMAYVRPHDMVVRPYQRGASGIVATISRAIVVGSIARLELLPQAPAAADAGVDRVIEAQMTAVEFAASGLLEGDTVTVEPKKARVFLQTPVAA
jgi:sulfate transport system ATP-binding protein